MMTQALPAILSSNPRVIVPPRHSYMSALIPANSGRQPPEIHGDLFTGHRLPDQQANCLIRQAP
jgi:hypothetical protein